jgi:hypothetical protein
MLIRSVPRAEGDELGGDDAWRSEYHRARRESGTGRFRRNTCEFGARGNENMPDFREAVESAASADPVTAIRRDWMRVLEDGLLRRRDREGNAITQIAMCGFAVSQNSNAQSSLAHTRCRFLLCILPTIIDCGNTGHLGTMGVSRVVMNG